MKGYSLILALCIAQGAGAQLVLNPQKHTLTGTWAPTNWASVPQDILAAHTAAGVDYPQGACVFLDEGEAWGSLARPV